MVHAGLLWLGSGRGWPIITGYGVLLYPMFMVHWTLFHGVAIIGLVLANGFFVAAEFALVSLRATRVEQLLAESRPGARAVAQLRGSLNATLSAVQFGVTVASLALGWLGEPVVAPLFERPLHALPHAALFAHAVSAGLAFACITYLEVIVGELVPKSLALRRPEQLALGVAPPMLVFIRLTRPFVLFMNGSATLVLRMFHSIAVTEEPVHSPDELKLMATATRRQGLLPAYQESLIHRAVELNTIVAREIMTPRQRIFSLPATMPVEEASARVVDEQHSRIPIYDPERGPEHIVGVVYSKDVSRLMHFAFTRAGSGQRPSRGLQLGQIMRDILVVPETKPVPDLLHEFQERRRHLAIVVDEHGSTVGLVTVEDALEQLVGEMEDEFDVGMRRAARMPAEAFYMDGGVNLRDLETQMHWYLPRDGGVETLAGFLLTQLGHIPTEGESVDFGGRRYTVAEMSGHRISRVRIEPVPSKAAAAHTATAPARGGA
ncbi:MAG: hemolysin family protein [Acidobacteriaceae bacterium]